MTPDEKRENAYRLRLREPTVGVGVVFDEDPTNGRCAVVNTAAGPWFFPDGELLFDSLPRTKKDEPKELDEELYDGYLYDTRRVADDNRLLHRSRPAAFEYTDGMISQLQRTCPHEDVSRLYIQKCAILLTGVPTLTAPYNSSAYMGPRSYQEFGVGPEAPYDTPDVFKCFDLQGAKLLADVKLTASKSAWVFKILPQARYLALGEGDAENLGWMIPASRHYPPTAWCGSPSQHVAQQQLLDMSTHGRLGGQAGFNCQAAWMLSLTSATERYRTVTRMMTVQGNPDVEIDGPSGAALLSPIHPVTNADWETWKSGVCRLMYSPATQCHSGTIKEPEPTAMAPHASRAGESYFAAVHVYVSYQELAHMLWAQFELAGIFSIPVWLGGEEDPLVGAERPRDDDLYQALPDKGTFPTMCGVAVPMVHPSHFESGAYPILGSKELIASLLAQAEQFWTERTMRPTFVFPQGMDLQDVKCPTLYFGWVWDVSDTHRHSSKGKWSFHAENVLDVLQGFEARDPVRRAVEGLCRQFYTQDHHDAPFAEGSQAAVNMFTGSRPLQGGPDSYRTYQPKLPALLTVFPGIFFPTEGLIRAAAFQHSLNRQLAPDMVRPDKRGAFYAPLLVSVWKVNSRSESFTHSDDPFPGSRLGWTYVTWFSPTTPLHDFEHPMHVKGYIHPWIVPHLSKETFDEEYVYGGVGIPIMVGIPGDRGIRATPDDWSECQTRPHVVHRVVLGLEYLAKVDPGGPFTEPSSQMDIACPPLVATKTDIAETIGMSVMLLLDRDSENDRLGDLRAEAFRLLTIIKSRENALRFPLEYYSERSDPDNKGRERIDPGLCERMGIRSDANVTWDSLMSDMLEYQDRESERFGDAIAELATSPGPVRRSPFEKVELGKNPKSFWNRP